MNRIVLIGNGFDLAHELPTRYEDFLLGYFKKAIKSCKENKENQTGLEYTKKEIDYKNRLIEVQYNEPFSAIQDEDFTSLNNLFRSGKYYFEHLENGGVDQIDYLFGGDVRECTITIKSDFFKQLLARKYRRWADIEGYYFEYLTNAYEAGGFSREKKNTRTKRRF